MGVRLRNQWVQPREPTKHQYDYDAQTVMGFLRHYGLDKDYKLNIEVSR